MIPLQHRLMALGIALGREFLSGGRTSWSRSYTGSSGGGLRHFEWATEWVSSPSATSSPHKFVDDGKLMVFLHGLLGNKRNVKGLASSVCTALGIPGLLVDVRGHGDSQLPAHVMQNTTHSSLQDCVWDLHQTLQVAVPDIQERELMIMGHSMGGRVTMLYALTQNVIQQPSHIWLLDTVPGRISGSVLNVLNVAQKLVEENADIPRRELAKVLVEQHQLDVATAQWLATAYDPSLPGKFKFDLKVANDLVQEFATMDFVSWLEQARRDKTVGVHLVRGGANTAWESTNTVDLLQSWEKQDRDRRKFSFHTLPKAGHWVHIDDPQGLLGAVKSVHLEEDDEER